MRMRCALVMTLLLSGCGADVPVTEDSHQVDVVERMTQEDWDSEVKKRLKDFEEPRLSTRQKQFSHRFSLRGDFGRKFAYLAKTDSKLSRAISTKAHGLLKICPRYALLDAEDKTRVWTSIMDAIAFGETAYRPELTYLEKFEDASGNRVVSTGLFQLSQMSARNHGASCSEATTEKLKDAGFNVMCAYRVMTNQILRTHTLYFEDRRFYYWSILSRGRNPEGFGRFMGRLSQLLRDSERWPQSCGLPERF